MSKATRKNPAKRTPGAKATSKGSTASSSKRMRSAPSKPSKPGKRKPKAASHDRSANSSTRVSSPKPDPDYVDPLKPFHWREPGLRKFTDEERQRAVDHICRCLAQGGVELVTIRNTMVPKLPKQTLTEWREMHPEWDQAIDDAFDAGCALDVLKAQRIADGIQPLTYGHTTAAQRSQYRQDVKRDRLRIHVIFKRVEAINRRYKPRNIIEGDEDHPLVPSKFEITPVKPMHAADPSINDHEEE
jgi:hypothetical protein